MAFLSRVSSPPLRLCRHASRNELWPLTRSWSEISHHAADDTADTTRDPRPGEVRGQSYHYVTREEFEELVQAGAFLEHAQFGGNRYGTTAKAVADVSTEGVKGADGSTDARRAILDIDAQGVKLIKANHPSLNPIYIFISPPSFSTLKQRLIGRGTETPESVHKRLSMAANEMEYAREKGAHDWIIVNDDLDKAYALLKKAINETLQKGEDDKMPAKDQDEEEWQKQQQQQQQ